MTKPATVTAVDGVRMTEQDRINEETKKLTRQIAKRIAFNLAIVATTIVVVPIIINKLNKSANA